MCGLGFVLIVIGLILNYFNIKSHNFEVFGRIGNWLIYIDFIELMIATVRILIKKKPKIADEKMGFIANKALKITFIFIGNSIYHYDCRWNNNNNFSLSFVYKLFDMRLIDCIFYCL